MLASAFFEAITITSLVPFLSILINPYKINDFKIFKDFGNFLNIDNPNEYLLPITIIFCFAILLSGLIRIINLALSNNLAALIGSDLSYDCYKKTLYQPYLMHTNQNTSKIIGVLTDFINGTVIALNAYLQMMTAFIISIFLLITLCTLNIKVASTVILIIIIFYIFISIILRQKFKANSLIISKATESQIKRIQEGLGAIRDLLLSGTQSFYLKKFEISDKRKRLKRGENNFLGSSPKFALESIGLILIAIIAYKYSNQNNKSEDIIPFLGALALGAQKLLPACQQVYLNWSCVKQFNYEIDEVIKLLVQKVEDDRMTSFNKKLNFKKSISIKNLSFAYDKNSSFRLKGINIIINRGDRLGIIGKTGSGKSTLIDIMMGLIKPDSGQINLDGINLLETNNNKSWKASIAHVPQNIYLTDSSIEENIAFGIKRENIDYELVKLCAKKAQIDEYIKKLSNGYKTFIGERGVKLSGGQKQRIGIARALYRKAKILFLDEATSALDNETEKDFLKALDNLSNDITLVIVAHRLTTIKKCNKIIELKEGEIINQKNN